MLTDDVSYIQDRCSLIVCNVPIIVSLVCRIFSRGPSRPYARRRAVDDTLDPRTYRNRDAFGFGQGTDSPSTENDTVITAELDTHIQNEEKTDPEA